MEANMTGNELRELMATQGVTPTALAYLAGYTEGRIHQVLRLRDEALPERTAAILRNALQSLARKKKVS